MREYATFSWVAGRRDHGTTGKADDGGVDIPDNPQLLMVESV
jgi:hypothetical protein